MEQGVGWIQTPGENFHLMDVDGMSDPPLMSVHPSAFDILSTRMEGGDMAGPLVCLFPKEGGSLFSHI